MNPLLKLKCLRMLKGTKLNFTPKAIIIGAQGRVHACSCIPVFVHSWEFPMEELIRHSMIIGTVGWIGDEEAPKSILIL
jgi:hypothetical protein